MPNRKGKRTVNNPKNVLSEEPSSETQPNISVTEAFHKPDHVNNKTEKTNKSRKCNKLELPEPCESTTTEYYSAMSATGNSYFEEEECTSANRTPGSRNQELNSRKSLKRFDGVGIRFLKRFVMFVLHVSTEWSKPLIDILVINILIFRDYVGIKSKHAFPIVLRWFTYFTKVLLRVLMIWLNFSHRGMNSVIRMGTSSFFLVIWCSIFSLVSMIGMFKLVAVVVIVILVELFVGTTGFGLMLLPVSGIFFLWLYGSFWTTLTVILFGGISLIFDCQHLALLVTTLYSLYSAWTYVGLLGIFIAFNLSFFSSDADTFFMRNDNIAPRPTPRMRASFTGGGTHSTAHRGSGVPLTSGSGPSSVLTSEDEVIRLINSTDHYSTFGFSKFQEIDVSVLKRVYKKKAILVHPDKNMGNEKAADAFMKLQNAYEVLLDASKRKAYDDKLRTEDLLTYIRRSPSRYASQGFSRSQYTSRDFASSRYASQDFASFRYASQNFASYRHTSQGFSRSQCASQGFAGSQYG